MSREIAALVNALRDLLTLADRLDSVTRDRVLGTIAVTLMIAAAIGPRVNG